jgi:hypothetical protein
MTSLRTTLLLFGCIFLSLSVFSQNVTILPGGITPMQSSTYPRLSYDEIAALTSPNDGDIAYDITFKCLRLYNGTKWVRLVSDDDLNIPSMTGWSAGGSGSDEGISIANDLSGNIFVTGSFSGTASFGDTSVTSAGNLDLFIAKYNNNGILKWLRTAGGTDNDASRDIDIDTEGNVFITGGIQATATFGTTSITSGGGGDIFIAKYSSTGTFLWVRQGVGSGDETANSIALDSEGNPYITGYFYNTVSFGAANITSAGELDVFLVKYNTSGVLQWLQRTGGAYTDFGRAITVDPNGYVYITGYTSGPTTIGNIYFPGSGGADIFIAKYNPFTNSWIWTINGLSLDNDSGTAIKSDANGYIYLTGYFGSTLNLYGTTITSAGLFDIWVAKFTNNGVLVWLKRAGGADYDVGVDLLTDSSGNVYVTGYFAETDFFGNISVTSAGQADIFIAKYNSAGVVQWVERAGDTAADAGSGIAIDDHNNIYVTGYFQNNAKFGTKNIISAGIHDIFIARLKE